MKTSGKIWDIATSEKIEALVCNPDGDVCFGSGGPEGDNAIMTEAIAEVKFMEKRIEELEGLLNENTERLEYWKNLAIHWRIKE
jgi:hypothetical protein